MFLPIMFMIVLVWIKFGWKWGVGMLGALVVGAIIQATIKVIGDIVRN